MSYILDALKKDQARQAGPGLKLGVQSNQPGPLPRWLGISLGLILIANLALLVWLFVIPRLAENEPATVAQTTTAAPDPLPASEPITVAESAETATPSPVAEPAPAPPASSTTPKPATQPAPQRQPIESVALLDLPEGQQTLFNSFTYSTHIYTDDPQLCAIVIDGIRLTAGIGIQRLESPAHHGRGSGIRTTVQWTTPPRGRVHHAAVGGRLTPPGFTRRCCASARRSRWR